MILQFSIIYDKHQTGDVILKTLGNLLKKYEDKYKDKIEVARAGGEEFTIIGKGISESELKNITDEIRQELKSKSALEYIKENDESVYNKLQDNQKEVLSQKPMNFSAGIGDTFDDADARLYAAKDSGRGNTKSISDIKDINEAKEIRFNNKINKLDEEINDLIIREKGLLNFEENSGQFKKGLKSLQNQIQTIKNRIMALENEAKSYKNGKNYLTDLDKTLKERYNINTKELMNYDSTTYLGRYREASNREQKETPSTANAAQRNKEIIRLTTTSGRGLESGTNLEDVNGNRYEVKEKSERGITATDLKTNQKVEIPNEKLPDYYIVEEKNQNEENIIRQPDESNLSREENEKIIADDIKTELEKKNLPINLSEEQHKTLSNKIRDFARNIINTGDYAKEFINKKYTDIITTITRYIKNALPEKYRDKIIGIGEIVRQELKKIIDFMKNESGGISTEIFGFENKNQKEKVSKVYYTNQKTYDEINIAEEEMKTLRDKEYLWETEAQKRIDNNGYDFEYNRIMKIKDEDFVNIPNKKITIVEMGNLFKYFNIKRDYEKAQNLGIKIKTLATSLGQDVKSFDLYKKKLGLLYEAQDIVRKTHDEHFKKESAELKKEAKRISEVHKIIENDAKPEIIKEIKKKIAKIAPKALIRKLEPELNQKTEKNEALKEAPKK